MTSWLCHIERHHFNKEYWHYVVDYIFLDPKGSVGVLFDAINDVNRKIKFASILGSVPQSLPQYLAAWVDK